MHRNKRVISPQIEVSFSKQNQQMNLQQSKLNVQILRVQTTQKISLISQVWSLNQSQLCQYLIKYQPFPYNDFSTQQLLDSNNLKLIKNDGKLYFGQMERKKKEGKGLYIQKEGKLYQGDFTNNEKNGMGVEIYSNGNLYIGQFTNNKKHGKGKFFWFNLTNKKIHHNTEFYEGDWWGGLPDGQGIHQKINGDVYTGTFKNGLKHGQGEEYFGNGDHYKGEYINGLPEGFGEYRWKDGSKYKGDLKQGLRNGYGVWEVNSQGCQYYKGHYQNDKKCGYGVYEWENGWLYKGNFYNDYREGYGELYDGNEVVYRGYWEGGEQVDGEKGYKERHSQTISKNQMRNSKTIESSLKHLMKSVEKHNPQQTSKTQRHQFSIKKRPQSFCNLNNQRPQPPTLRKLFVSQQKNVKSNTTSTIGSTINRPIMRTNFSNNLYVPGSITRN